MLEKLDEVEAAMHRLPDNQLRTVAAIAFELWCTRKGFGTALVDQFITEWVEDQENDDFRNALIDRLDHYSTPQWAKE